jgi:hypothetical protein
MVTKNHVQRYFTITAGSTGIQISLLMEGCAVPIALHTFIAMVSLDPDVSLIWKTCFILLDNGIDALSVVIHKQISIP